MKKSHLKQIIKEELQKVVEEVKFGLPNIKDLPKRHIASELLKFFQLGSCRWRVICSKVSVPFS